MGDPSQDHGPERRIGEASFVERGKDDRRHGGRGEGSGGSEPGPRAREAERLGTGRSPGRAPTAAPRFAERSVDDRRRGGRGEGSVDPSRAHGPEKRSGVASPAERSRDDRRHGG
jgi:hypothetical protein